ncbi:MAG: CHAT domain-containing protein, partial [Acidobacteria bacterium]|nr:CHAT domain-containing protein [Acidobacteriota bacterium]
SFALPATRANLENKVRLLGSTLDPKKARSDQAGWKPVAESLRRSLIEPIERSNILENANRLAIVPYGFLHDLPFAALTKNDDGNQRFLVEDYDLFYPPSATFLAANKPSGRKTRMITFGLNGSGKEDLPPLKFAEEESRSVAQVFSGEAILENRADETEFKRLAPKATHLHIAAHAFAEQDMPLFSRLILRSSKMDDGNLTTREVFELGIDTELVTIAACEGAKSFSADPEGLIEIDRIGLTEAFLNAGSRSVLASLAPISDRATTDLMTTFYTNLRTKDKAASLSLAQRKMIGSPVYQHPRYWANFVLIGSDH